MGAEGYGGGFTTTGVILVLFILLVIVSTAGFLIYLSKIYNTLLCIGGLSNLERLLFFF